MNHELPPLGPLVPIRKGSKGHSHMRNWQKVSPKVLQEVMERHYPGCNVGLRLDSYLALDPDSEDAEAFLGQLERNGKLPPTVAWRSASGRVTRLYKPPAGVIVKPIGPSSNVFSLELRIGKGNQCLIPPSEAENKQKPGELRRYKWVNDPWTTAVAVLPRETLEIIRGLPKPQGARKGDGKPKSRKSAKAKKDRLVVAPDSIPDGQRNDTLFRLGCSMRGRGADQNKIEAELQELNRARCVPPLEVREVAKIAQSAAKYPVNTPNSKVLSNLLRVTYDQVVTALEELGGREERVKRKDLIKKLQKMTGSPGSIIRPPVSEPTIDRRLKEMRSKRLISYRKDRGYKLPKRKRP